MKVIKRIMDASCCITLLCVLLATGGINTAAIGTASAIAFFTTFVITFTYYLRHENK